MYKFLVQLSIFLFFQFCLKFSSAQNIYDADNSFQFAKYLFDNKEFIYAAEEFERVVFLSPENIEAKEYLMKTYRLSEKYLKGITYYENNFDYFLNIPENISVEYSKLLLLNSNYNELINYQNSIMPKNSEFKDNIILLSYIMQNKFEKAFEYSTTTTNINSELKKLINSRTELKYKSPVIATSLSVLLPGLGKIYAGSWKDGLFSLFFIATNSWQAYRGFSKKGVESYYGWFFGSVAFSFYIANIYGTIKWTKKYNHDTNEKYKNAALDIFNNNF